MENERENIITVKIVWSNGKRENFLTRGNISNFREAFSQGLDSSSLNLSQTRDVFYNLSHARSVELICHE